MKITQLRNATIIVSYQEDRILVDPMLAPQGAILPFKWFTAQEPEINKGSKSVISIEAESYSSSPHETCCAPS